MQHGAAVAYRMAASRRQHAADVAIGHRAAGEVDGSDETLAAEAAAGKRYHHGFELHLGLAFGDVDGLADHLLDLDQVDYAAGFHTAGRGMGKSENAHAVRAPPQHVLRRLRLEPGDQAGDLAGADIEAGHHRGAPRRNRLHLGCDAEAQHGHASLPFFFVLFFSAALSAASRAAAAASDCRTVTRSDSRRSTATMSRDSSFFSRSRSTSVVNACSGWRSGNSTSTPSLSFRFQRRSATSTEASTDFAI